MLIGSGLQALATSGKFKPVALGQIRTAGNSSAKSARRAQRPTSPDNPRRIAEVQAFVRQRATAWRPPCWRDPEARLAANQAHDTTRTRDLEEINGLGFAAQAERSASRPLERAAYPLAQ
jgi:hypothetical protein